MSKHVPNSVNKKTPDFFNIDTIVDGVVTTLKPVPAGLGRIVYLTEKDLLTGARNYLPGLVMASSRESTIIFALAQSHLLSTKQQITVKKSLAGKRSTKLGFKVSISEFLGNTLNSLGFSFFSKTFKKKKSIWKLPKPKTGISDRLNVWKPLITGIKVIDCLFPIGLGQRQLIIGDRYTGKTSIAVDTIISQRRTNLKCIYVAIGQKKSAILTLVATLKRLEAYHFTTIVGADSAEAVALQFLAPYAGCSLAEIFSSLGGDALIVYDDLSKHSVAYRQMALLLRKSPGRDAFPSDIFYLHSNLLERAGQFFSGSLTALPIIETLSRDVSAFIPTNIISITDGQIFLDSDYYNKGILPAVHISLSVSRVGAKSQLPSMAPISKWVKIIITEYRKMESLLSFSDDVDKATMLKLNFGMRLSEFLNQVNNNPIDIFSQVILFAFVFKGALGIIPYVRIQFFISFFINWTGEFLTFNKYFLAYGKEQIFFFNIARKNFQNSSNFISFYCFILNNFIKYEWYIRLMRLKFLAANY